MKRIMILLMALLCTLSSATPFDYGDHVADYASHLEISGYSYGGGWTGDGSYSTFIKDRYCHYAQSNAYVESVETNPTLASYAFSAGVEAWLSNSPNIFDEVKEGYLSSASFSWTIAFDPLADPVDFHNENGDIAIKIPWTKWSWGQADCQAAGHYGGSYISTSWHAVCDVLTQSLEESIAAVPYATTWNIDNSGSYMIQEESGYEVVEFTWNNTTHEYEPDSDITLTLNSDDIHLLAEFDGGVQWIDEAFSLQIGSSNTRAYIYYALGRPEFIAPSN